MLIVINFGSSILFWFNIKYTPLRYFFAKTKSLLCQFQLGSWKKRGRIIIARAPPKSVSFVDMTSMASSIKITGFYWTFFFMLFVIFSSSTLAISSSQREFDYYLLALEWPGTMCKSVSKCCNTNGCCDRFYFHPPCCCCSHNPKNLDFCFQLDRFLKMSYFSEYHYST